MLRPRRPRPPRPEAAATGSPIVAVELLQDYLPGIRALRDVSTVDFAAYSEYLPEEVRKRAEHIVKEIHRVEQAIQVLRRGDTELFGGLMYSGHASLRDLYEVSCPELDILVDCDENLEGFFGLSQKSSIGK